MNVKVGDKIKIEWMEDESEYCGREGIVKYIDDMGQLYGTWGSLAVIPGLDGFSIIESN